MNRKISVGVLWNLANLVFSRGANTLFTLFLAKLLAPEAFGLIAMATVVFELANVFVQSGLGQALIREKSVSHEDLSTVFCVNLGLSLVAYSVIYITAPLIANFYSQPELTLIVRVIGLVIFINATKVVQLAVLNRAMNFHAQMKANTAAVLVSGGLALTAAYQGLGVWSLVIMMLSQATISSIIIWLMSSWLPSINFNLNSFKRLFNFSKSLLAEALLGVLYQNSYVLVIGRFFSIEVTGLYFFSKKMSNLISHQLTGAIQKATFPALSTLQDDTNALKTKYRQIMQVTLFVIAPVMALFAASSPAVFKLFFSDDWQDAVPFIQLLCGVGILYPIHALNMNLLIVSGRPDLVFKVGLLKKFINIILLIIAIPYGVLGIVISQLVGSAIALIPNTYFSFSLIKYSIFEQLKDFYKPVLGSCLAGVICAYLGGNEALSASYSIMLSLILGVGFYLLICVFFQVEGAKILLISALKKWSWLAKRLNR